MSTTSLHGKEVTVCYGDSWTCEVLSRSNGSWLLRLDSTLTEHSPSKLLIMIETIC